jgi:fluoroacetyl-CoA thioesterase
MPEGLRPGLTGEAKVLVSDANTAEGFGNAGAKVYATPMLVALMEQASIAAILPVLLPGEGSVGTRVEMSHTAATPIGMTVTARAELVEVAGKRLVFDVVASDEQEIVGKCRHERYIIGNMSAFLAKTAEKQKK